MTYEEAPNKLWRSDSSIKS